MERRNFLKTLAGVAGGLFAFRDVKGITSVPQTPAPTPMEEWAKGLAHTEAGGPWLRCTGASCIDWPLEK